MYIGKRISPACKSYYEKIMQINNQNLARILYLKEENNNIVAIREYISGSSLAQFVQNNGGTLSEQTSTSVICQVCNGLMQLHKNNLVHRDINPNNIMITTDGVVKIIDFGITRMFKPSNSTDTEVLGTPGYAAPEQFGFTQSNNKTDIYAVGVLLNVLVTGSLPNVKLAGGRLGKIVTKCTSIDAGQRYDTVDEIIFELTNDKQSYAEANCEHKLDKLVSLIPGIRSKNKIVVILSAIGHILIIFLSAFYFAGITKNLDNIILYMLSWILSVIVPYFCFNNFLNIRDRLPISKGATAKSKAILYNSIGAISIFVGLSIFGASGVK